MVTSNKTAVDVYRVIRQHVPTRDGRTALLEALSRVKGNRSFTDTVGLLLELHASFGDDDEEGTKAPRPIVFNGDGGEDCTSWRGYRD